MARKQRIKELDFPKALKDIIDVENKVYEKAGIVRTFIVSFPNRQKTPLLGRIGAKLIGMAGGVIQISYHQVDKK